MGFNHLDVAKFVMYLFFAACRYSLDEPDSLLEAYPKLYEVNCVGLIEGW